QSAGRLAPNVSVIEGGTQAGTQAGIEAKGPEKPQPPLAELFKQLNSSPQGLTTQEARQRLARFGTNEPAPAHHRALVVQVLLYFANPLVAILLFASLVSAIVGDQINTGIIFVIVLLSVAL